MNIAERFVRISFVLLAATTLAGCRGASESDEPQATADVEDAESPGATAEGESPMDDCPPDAEIVAVVGHPVQGKPWGSGCFYETADFTASVTIMRISAGQADQVQREMGESAAPYDAELGAIDVGDRGHAWGSPGYGQGYAVSGDRGWMVDVSIPAGDQSLRAEVVRILEMMIG